MYAPVRQHEFVNFDDPQYVSENPAVAGGLTAQGVRWAFTTGHAGNWHPLTWLSHMLDVERWDLNPGPHHATNVLLHLASTLMLFGLLDRMTGALFRSAFVAALFALHPLHVESVAWVAERKDVLSTLFFMLTLWGYLAYVRRPRWSRYAAVLALFVLGLMAKPMLVTLPFVLLLLDYWPLARGAARGAWRRLVLEKMPLLALAVASSAVTFVVQQRSGAVKALDALPLDRRVANAAVAYVAYIGQTLWPAGLSPLYPYPAALPAGRVAGAVLALTAVSVATIRTARRHPYLPVGWLWYLGTLVPVIGLVQVGSQPMADRYTYIPLVGLFIVAAWGGPALMARTRRRRLVLGAGAALLVVACAIAARRQVAHWRNSIALWEHAVEAAPASHRAHNNLGHALAKRGRLGEAVPHYTEALRLKPDYAEAHNNLGYALADQGHVREAIGHYTEALRVLPDYAEAHNNLGVALAAEGNAEGAVHHLSEAVRIEPGRAEAHNNLGAVLAGQGRLEDAMRPLSRAVELKPGYADARRNLATAHYELALNLAGQGRTSEAVSHLESVLKLDPSHREASDALRALTGR